jgi:hypothetical protein
VKTNLSTLLIAGIGLIFANSPALAKGDYYNIGVEWFTDRYREPSQDLKSHSDYGSITGTYMHYYHTGFLAYDGRVSYGLEDYKSPSGVKDDIPQLETEWRLRGGVRMPINASTTISPYVGLGMRYYYDFGQGKVTNRGIPLYDRRIMQAYVPIGVTMHYTTGGWTFSPNAEFDPMFYGWVSTRLKNTGLGLYNVDNNQTFGYGLRGELMIGREEKGFSWEAGPFVRYWKIRQSDYEPCSPVYYCTEPKNDRLQVGAKARIAF